MDLIAPALNRLIDRWIDEDIGRGDLTGVTLKGCKGSAYWITKSSGIFCGGTLVERIFLRLDPTVKVNLHISDGQSIQPEDRLLDVEGPASSLVAGERTALNLAMRLSGIASSTSMLVEKLKGTGVSLVDTRKTTPGLRVFEKYAIRCGGGLNHRLGLNDSAMLKENHLAWSKDVNSAVFAIRSEAPWPARVIIEAETPSQAEDAVIAGADGVLLDEFSLEDLHTTIPRLKELAHSRIPVGSEQLVIEASGVDVMDLKAYAMTGVDLISTSAPITKSSWLDFSMRFK